MRSCLYAPRRFLGDRGLGQLEHQYTKHGIPASTQRKREKARGIAEGVSAKHHTSYVMSDPILILYPYTWIDRFMSSVTSSERTQAFSSDARNGIGGTKIDSTTLLHFHFT